MTHSLLSRLRARWGVSTGQVFVILLVFACTGFTVMFLKRPIVALLTGDGEQSLLAGVAYYLLFLPVYNVILLAYGTLFGQFRFFWAFERRILARLRPRRRRDTDATGRSPRADL